MSLARPRAVLSRLKRRSLGALRGAFRRRHRAGEEDLRAVHYFGRASAVNFWDAADFSEAPAHLERIRADGFNAVIVVIPWRGFQRTLVPPAYDEQAFERLRRLLAMIEEAGLAVVLRVSYPFNHDPDSVGDFDERVLGLFSRPQVRAAWLHYLGRIRDVAEGFAGFRFAFFSWEDVPSLRELMHHRDLARRRQLAQSLGYREFLERRMDLAQASRIFGEALTDWAQVYVPLQDSEAYPSFHDFVNQALDQLLREGQAVWPKLAMQVRVDHDRGRVEGKDVWLENDIRVGDPGMRVTYYALCMYTTGQGGTLSPADALDNLERMLVRVSGGGANTNHFIDQFIFHEESPLYRHWPRMEESGMGAFLSGAAALLRKYSRGYAFWNYFDYRVNHFYNPAFVRGLHGWTVEGAVALRPRGEKADAVLEPGAAIAQRIDPHARGNAPWLYEKMQFAAMAQAPAGGRLAILANGVVEAEIEVGGGGLHAVAAEFPPERHRGGEVVVTLRNSGSVPVAIGEIFLWGFVYRAHIYDEHGRPGRYRAAVVDMLKASREIRP